MNKRNVFKEQARRILYFYSLAEKYGFKDPTSHYAWVGWELEW